MSDLVERLRLGSTTTQGAYQLGCEAADHIDALEAENVRLRDALHFYADFYEQANDGPWGVNSDDFGRTARAALQAQLADARNDALEEAAVAVSVRAASIRDGWVYDARDRALISKIVSDTAATIRAMKGEA